MEGEKLQAGYQRIMCTIYRPSEYCRRTLDSLQRPPRDVVKAHQYHGFKAVTAFLRIAIHLGVLDPAPPRVPVRPKSVEVQATQSI